MEEWQRELLTVNRAKLIEETTCNAQLLSHLFSEGVLAKVDVESIRCKKNRFDQASVLYDIIETRQNGFMVMIKSLGKVSQTGAQTVFLEGLARHATPKLKVNFLGMAHTLNETITEAELEKIIQEIRKHVKLEQYIELLDQSGGEIQSLVLMNDTIPAQLPFYIPRTLSKRVNVNPEIFKVDCDDVFVFKGVNCSQLAKLVEPQIIAPSTSQLLSLSTRFIFLVNDGDWEDICKAANVPVHLIKYEEKVGTYLLEESSGGSRILYQYLGASSSINTGDTTNQAISIKISEEQFLQATNSHSSRGVCICDLPGMGKSQLLANLARKMKHDHPERLVAFIQLSLFSDVAFKKIGRAAKIDASLVRNILFEYVSPTPLACILLTALVNNTGTRLEVFLDGFDEVLTEHIPIAKQMMTIMSNELQNTRVHVTSRPHMRLELEAALKMISYDILPLSQNDQVNFLKNLWVKKEPRSSEEKLCEFADHCLVMLRTSLSSDEREITGIPLQCRLVAEVFARNAIIFAKPDRNVALEETFKIEGSLSELYQRYTELCFSKIRAHITQSDSNKCILYAPVEPAKRMMEAVVGDKACSMSQVEQVRDYHVFLALQTLFPQLTKVFSKVFTFVEKIDDRKLFSAGMLQRRFTGNCESIEFLHRTFAEFLVAEWFACFFNGELSHIQSPKGKIKEFLFKELISMVDYGNELNDTLVNDGAYISFKHPVVIHFFNFFCIGKKLIYKNKFSNLKFPACVPGDKLYWLIGVVVSGNYVNIFILINEILSHMEKNKLRKYTEDIDYFNSAEFINLLNKAAQYSSLALVKQLFQFSRDFFAVDLDTVCGEMLPRKYEFTPLDFALERENYEMIQYFADRVPYDTSWLIYKIADISSYASHLQLQRIVDIGNMLFERKSNLCRDVKISIQCDLNLDTVKLFLLQKAGVSPRSNVIRKDGDEFKQLYRLFIEDGRGIYPFVYKDGEWKCKLSDLLWDNDIYEQDIEMLISNCLRVDRDNVEETTPPLICAAEGHRSLAFLKTLIEAGADGMSKDDEGNTFAHTSPYFYTPVEYHEIVQLLIDKQMGNVFRTTNKNGATPLHLALEQLEVLPETLQLLAGGDNGSSSSGESQTDIHFHSYANLNAVNAFGESLLHVAITGKRSLTLIKQLVELGVNWSVKSNHNTNLVNRCSSYGLLDHLKYFVQLGCDINELDNVGDNALQCVIGDAYENIMEIVEFLLVSGVRKENVNKIGKTAFDYAIERGTKNARLLKLLQC